MKSTLDVQILAYLTSSYNFDPFRIKNVACEGRGCVYTGYKNVALINSFVICEKKEGSY